MTDTPKKVRKSRLPADPRAAVEKRVGKTKNAIRGLAKKFPKEVLTEESIAKITAFLRLQVTCLESDLKSALRSGSVTIDGFSLDAPEVAQPFTKPPAPNYRAQTGAPSGAVSGVPRALAATAEEAPDLVRVLEPGARKAATPDVTEIDFVEE